MSDGDKIAREIVDVVSRYCESQMINPTDVHIQLAADKEGKLHIVTFNVSIS
jgi:septum formation topological specificity factor MinE